MSEQALNLRTSIQIVRRRKRLFGIIIVLGILAGVFYGVLKPSTLSSTALVVLSGQQSGQATDTNGGVASSGSSSGESSFIATQVVIASSDAVLARALPHVSPPTSLQSLFKRVQVQSVTGSILSISARGGTAEQAEATANAIANSYISYVNSPKSPVGRVPAAVLESATNATGPKQSEQIAIFALVGALAGALVGFVVALAIGRHDRRLTERDAIANSIGLPVLASLPVGRPSDAASWANLLAEYEPGVVHAWGLRKMLQQFGVIGYGSDGEVRAGASITVLSLSSDRGALALGPQVASYAASLGIPTALVIGPQQDAGITATLRTACASSPQAAPQTAGSHKPLQLIASDDGRMDGAPPALVVVVAVVDDRAPSMPQTVRTNLTVLGVSAGLATEEQLARAATAAAADGREILGILVADPEPGDQTTGRIPRLASSGRRRLPTRLQGIPMESRR
jgi:capsular polysaccharide biosynthesis protein